MESPFHLPDRPNLTGNFQPYASRRLKRRYQAMRRQNALSNSIEVNTLEFGPLLSLHLTEIFS